MSTILLRSIYFALIPIIFISIIVPALFFFFPSIMQHVFFLNFVRFPYVDYYNLQRHGVRGRGRNFYLHVGEYLGNNNKTDDESNDDENKTDKIKLIHLHPTIGVWHILPSELSALHENKVEDGESKKIDEKELECSLDEHSHGIFIYFHGNSFDRSAEHRCELYNILSAMDFHVLTIDYRGYGDSTGQPTEDGLNSDAHAIWEYARRNAPTKDIYIWGHSMGTGVATRLAAELSDAGTPPCALVLESPFNNLRDVVRNHPFSIPFRRLPWFDWTVIHPLIRSGLQMSSDQRVQRVTCPILVLHAEDDHIIPIDLGKKLVDSAVSANRKVKFVKFAGDREFLHKFIHRAHELPSVVKDFLEDAQLPDKGRTSRYSEEEIKMDDE
jgi:abhydrolase domain-containing protein 12